MAEVVFTDEVSGAEKPSAPATENTATERPAWLPEHFSDVDTFVKSATDTKAELTRVQQELAALKKAPAEKPADAPADEAPAPKPEDAPEKPEGDLDIPEAPASVDLTVYEKEYEETGDVAEERRDEIAKQLFPALDPAVARQYIDQYIEAAKVRDSATKAAAETQTESLYKAVGGQEAYTDMVKWAATNLSPAERDAFNKSVNSGDFAAQSLAVEGLKSKWQGAVGRIPGRVLAGNPGNPGVQAYESSAQMRADMRDPRYKTDPAFRAKVEQRVAISNI